jgi:hypothetical protein
MATLREYLGTFMTVSRFILLITKNVSNISSKENQNTNFMFNKSFSQSREVYEIMWKNIVDPNRPQMTV